MLKTGLVSITFRNKTPEEIVAEVCKCHLDGIEWGADVHVLPGDIARARAVRKLTQNAGLEVLAYGSYFEVGVQAVDTFAPVLSSAKALGAPSIRVWAGKKGSAESSPADVQQIVHDTQILCDMAAADKIQICFEYHGRTLTDTCSSALSVATAIDRPNLRLYWQPNFRLSEEENRSALRMVMPFLRDVHVFYWNEAYERFPLSDSLALWQSFRNIICSDSASHSLMLEFVRNDSFNQLEQDATALHAIIASNAGVFA